MNELYKSLFIEKISKFVCFIKYKNGRYEFEKPFQLGENPFQNPNVINLIDYTTKEPVSLYFDDILMFYTKYENDIQQSVAECERIVSEYRNIFSSFKFLKGRALHDLFFRVDICESQVVRFRNLKILDSLQLNTMEDYEHLLNGEKTVMDILKKFWYSKIMERYNTIISSLSNEESTAQENSFIEELKNIKKLIQTIPSDVEKSLELLNTYEDVLYYWPPLLLPRPTEFNV
jgi:hypothetical protein